MRILVVNPNTSEEMTGDIGEEARRYARPGTEIETVCPAPALDCQRDASAAQHEIAVAARAAVAADGAEAIFLGCAGMGPLDKVVEAEVGVPVPDGVACAVKLLEGIVDYGLATSRVAAYKEPEAKGFSNYGPTSNAVVS